MSEYKHTDLPTRITEVISAAPEDVDMIVVHRAALGHFLREAQRLGEVETAYRGVERLQGEHQVKLQDARNDVFEAESNLKAARERLDALLGLLKPPEPQRLEFKDLKESEQFFAYDHAKLITSRSYLKVGDAESGCNAVYMQGEQACFFGANTRVERVP